MYYLFFAGVYRSVFMYYSFFAGVYRSVRLTALAIPFCVLRTRTALAIPFVF